MRICKLKKKAIIFSVLSNLIFSLNSYAITITPSIKVIETDPEKAETFVVKVYNESGEKNFISSYINDFDIDRNGNKVFKPVGSTHNSISKYIKIIEPSSFYIEPKETKEVFFTLNVPKSIVGGNKSIIFFQSKSAEDVNASKKNIKKMIMSVRAGATILQESKGTTEIKSRISKIDIIKPSPSGSQNLIIKLKIKNEGNTFVNTSGNISLIRDDDTYVSSATLEEKIIYQNRESPVEANFTSVKKLDPGLYHALITYKYRDKTISIDKTFQID